VQRTIDEYAKVSAKRKTYKKREDELREELIPFLRKHKCPAKGPYLVSLNDVKRSDFCWESFAKLQMKKLGKTVSEIRSIIKASKKKAGKVIVPTLTVSVNSKWRD
jgi:hypothetical protein